MAFIAYSDLESSRTLIIRESKEFEQSQMLKKKKKPELREFVVTFFSALQCVLINILAVPTSFLVGPL